MSNWKRKVFDLSWGRLNVWTAGKGPVLVALHGLGGSGRYWHGLANSLEDRWTLVAPDLAGFGRSDKPVLRYDRAFHLATLEAMTDHLGRPEPWVVIGHSVGAVLAALWASEYPDRTRALAMISAPYPRPELMPPPARRLAAAAPDDRGRLAIGVFRTLWPAISLAARASRRFPGGLISDYGRQSIGARADTMFVTLADPTVHDALAPLAELSARWPNLLMAAADDRYVGSLDLERWQRLLPSAERVIVPTGGHQFLIRTGFHPLATWLEGVRDG